jgi:hypothetical protein
MIDEVFSYVGGRGDFEVVFPDNELAKIYPNTTLEMIQSEIDEIEADKEAKLQLP